MAADERGNLAVVLCHLIDNWAGKGRLEIDFYFYTCEIRGCLNTGHLLPVLGEGGIFGGLEFTKDAEHKLCP